MQVISNKLESAGPFVVPYNASLRDLYMHVG